MTKARLLSTVAASLLLTASVASAQAPKQDEAPARAPAAQQKAPAEKIAPAMKPGEHKAGAEQKAPATTTGQAPADADKSKATEKRAPGGAPQESSPANGSVDMKAKSENRSENKSDIKTDNKSASDHNAAQPSAKSASDAKTDTKSSATTGQGAAGTSAKLSTEQRTKITTIIKQQKVEKVAPAKLNVSISVGTRIPDRGVHFYPLPREVVVIYPEWRGYDYILVGDQIVVVDPRTHEIVAILEA